MRTKKEILESQEFSFRPDMEKSKSSKYKNIESIVKTMSSGDSTSKTMKDKFH